jgi:hypothetical protein
MACLTHQNALLAQRMAQKPQNDCSTLAAFCKSNLYTTPITDEPIHHSVLRKGVGAYTTELMAKETCPVCAYTLLKTT